MGLAGFRVFIGEQLISQPCGRHDIVTTNLCCFCAKVRFGAKRIFGRMVRFCVGVCLGAESTNRGLLKGLPDLLGVVVNRKNRRGGQMNRDEH